MPWRPYTLIWRTPFQHMLNFRKRLERHIQKEFQVSDKVARGFVSECFKEIAKRLLRKETIMLRKVGIFYIDKKKPKWFPSALPGKEYHYEFIPPRDKIFFTLSSSIRNFLKRLRRERELY